MGTQKMYDCGFIRKISMHTGERRVLSGIMLNIYSGLLLSQLRLSRIIPYLKVKMWSLFK